MKTLKTLILTMMLLPLVANAKPEIGKPAPAFSLSDSNGTSLQLKDFSGKKVILEWTNHDCPFVKKHYGSGNMQALQKKYTDDGVVWLSIISSAEGKQGHVSAAEANTLTSKRKAFPSHVLFDPEGTVGQAYAARATPQMFVIDEQGTLRYNGAIDSIPSADKADIGKAENYLVAAMDNLSAGESVAKPLTRPYGCSVKYK